MTGKKIFFMTSGGLTVLAFIGGILWFHHMDKAILQRLKAEKRILARMETSYLKEKIIPQTVKKIESADVHAFVSHAYLNEIMTGLKGYRIYIPEHPDVIITVKDLHLVPEAILPSVSFTATAFHEDSGVSVTLVGQGALYYELMEDPTPHIVLRVHLIDILPEAQWNRWNLHLKGFSRRFLTIKAKDLGEQIPPLEIPIALNVPFTIPGQDLQARFRIGQGIIEGTFSIPSYQFSLQLSLIDVLNLPNGLHFFFMVNHPTQQNLNAKAQDPETNMAREPASLKQRYLRTYQPLIHAEHDIGITMRTPLIENFYSAFNRLDDSRRTATFRLTHHEPPLVNRWKGGLGCGLEAGIADRELQSRFLVQELEGHPTGDNGYQIQARVSMNTRGRIDARIRGPRCPFKSCEECVLTSVRVKRPVRLAHTATLPFQFVVENKDNHALEYAIRLARPVPLDLNLDVFLPVVGKKTFPIRVTLKPKTLYHGEFPSFLEKKGRLAFNIEGIASFNRFYRITMKNPNLTFTDNGITIKANLSLDWENPSRLSNLIYPESLMGSDRKKPVKNLTVDIIE